jgi:DNA-directed RNA polymerase subunit F
MIEKSQSLSMTESTEYVKDEENSEIKRFMEKFVKLSVKDAKQLRENIEKMDLLKVRSSHISKIIDVLPKSKEELNKIFTDVTLDEDESEKILDTIKQFN